MVQISYKIKLEDRLWTLAISSSLQKTLEQDLGSLYYKCNGYLRLCQIFVILSFT